MVALMAIIMSLITFFAEFVYNPDDIKVSLAQHTIGKDSTNNYTIDLVALLINSGKTHGYVAVAQGFLCELKDFPKDQKNDLKKLDPDKILSSSIGSSQQLSAPNSMAEFRVPSKFDMDKYKSMFGDSDDVVYGIKFYFLDAEGNKYSKHIISCKYKAEGPYFYIDTYDITAHVLI